MGLTEFLTRITRIFTNFPLFFVVILQQVQDRFGKFVSDFFLTP